MNKNYIYEFDCEEYPLVRCAVTGGMCASSILDCKSVLMAHPWRIFSPKKDVIVCFYDNGTCAFFIDGVKKEDAIGSYAINEELNLSIKDEIGSMIFSKKVLSYSLDCILLEVRGDNHFSSYDYTMTILYFHKFTTECNYSGTKNIVGFSPAHFTGEFILHTEEELIQFLTYRKYKETIIDIEKQYEKLETINMFVMWSIPTLIVLPLLIVSIVSLGEFTLVIGPILVPVLYALIIWAYRKTIANVFYKRCDEKLRGLKNLAKNTMF